MTDTPSPNDMPDEIWLGWNAGWNCAEHKIDGYGTKYVKADLRAPVAAGGEAEMRINAAKKRLGDAKAIHSAWYVMPKYQADVYAAEQMGNIEQIIYSAICYLDGIDGPYLREQPHPAPAVDLERLKIDCFDKFKTDMRLACPVGETERMAIEQTIDHLAAQGIIKGVE